MPGMSPREWMAWSRLVRSAVSKQVALLRVMEMGFLLPEELHL